MRHELTKTVLTLVVATLAGGCPASETPRSHADACDLYVERMVSCNEPSNLKTWLVPTGDPGIPRRNCMCRMDEPLFADSVRCVLASDGRCSQLYECREWTAWKHTALVPEPDRPPPAHMMPDGATR